MITINEAKNVDVKDIIARSSVRNEPNAEKILREYLYKSIEAWCWRVDNRVAAMWGVIAPSFLSESAYLWLLTTDTVDEHKFIFVRHSQMVLNNILNTWPILIGHTVATQKQSVKWLQLLGVKFGRPIRTDSGEEVIPFEIRKKANG